MKNLFIFDHNKFCIYAIILFNLFFTFTLFAQESNLISEVNTSQPIVNEPLTLTASLLQPEITSNVRLAYRIFSESEFTIVDMEVLANQAKFTIPSEEVQLPSLLYYLIIQMTNGTIETYPLQIPELNTPIELVVSERSQKENEILLLSPSSGEKLALEDVFISLSFVRAPDNIIVAETKIYIDEEDISDKVLLAGDLILFNAENFPGTVQPGQKNLTVEVYDDQGNLYHTISSSFTASSKKAIEAEKTLFTYGGNVKAESRNENKSSDSRWFNNLTTDLHGEYADWDFRGFAYITSEEESNKQPRNRFFIEASTDWMKIRGGDSYPTFPQMIMNGKRVRGISGDIKLGYFNVKSAYGAIKRNVEGKLLNTYSSDDVPLQSNIVSIDESKYGKPYGEINSGTFSRDIFALRPSFGSGENFQLGFTYFHSSDDLNSIEFGGSPRENVVLGTDLKLNLDDNNIIFRTAAAFSLFNDDITNGDLSNSEIDTVFGNDDAFVDVDPQTIKDIKSILGSFITVNQNIGPLNPQEFSSLGAEASLQFNYFNNNLKASYIYRGNDYTSFGQDFIRKDIKGFNFADRIRVWENRLFFTLGYERLEDNLQETKFSTTIFQTYNAAVSIFPRMNMPNITISFSRNQNKNDINIADTITNFYYVDLATTRISTNLSYSFNTGVRHNSSLNFTSSNTDDNSINNFTANVFSSSLSLNSFWSNDLNSYFSFSFFNSDIAGSEYKYFTLSFGSKYKLMKDKLELRATIRPTFGDLDQQVLDLLANYKLIENLNIAFQFRLFRRPNISTDSIAGLTLRYNLI